MRVQSVLAVFLCAVVLNLDLCCAYFNVEKQKDCFCKLSGKIDECSCNIDTVDYFNNVKIYPRLKSLLVKDYFRFFKVNLKRPCPFWTDDSKCAMRYCHVKSCEEGAIPAGIKGLVPKKKPVEKPSDKYNKQINEDCTSHHNELDFINKTLSEKAQKDVELWQAHDDAQENFCDIDENDEEAEYVDLLLNPERYTGYSGPSAKRIWESIYLENCFRPKKTFNYNPYIQSGKLNELCLEERVFYRVISGLHASINTHLSANYLLSDSNGLSFKSLGGEWGPNVEEFVKRFSPETTNGEGPNWLRNLYFIYLLELRALAKAEPFLRKEEYYTGSETEDWDTRMAVNDLLNIVKQFPEHFDESTMFRNSEQANKLKYEFKQHFRNITKIMDCVGCEKCRLWGKLQTQGLGTALKILFSKKFDQPAEAKDSEPDRKEEKSKRKKRKEFTLSRTEIVALVNAIGRLSTSIYKLDDFRQTTK